MLIAQSMSALVLRTLLELHQAGVCSPWSTSCYPGFAANGVSVSPCIVSFPFLNKMARSGKLFRIGSKCLPASTSITDGLLHALESWFTA